MDPSVLPPENHPPENGSYTRGCLSISRGFTGSPLQLLLPLRPLEGEQSVASIQLSRAELSIWKIPSVYSPVGNFTRLPRLWNYRCRCRIFKTDSSEDFWKSNRIGIGRGIFLKKKNEIKYPEDIFDAIRIGVFFSFSIPEYSLDDFGDDDNFISLSRILSMKHFDRVNYLARDATSKK